MRRPNNILNRCYCNMFAKTEVRKWECKSSTDKTWMYAKTYFETLSTEKQTFQGDTGAGESGCESVNNI